jgi:hypothetical protein
MSRAGKAVKLKSVTQAVPNYVMSYFQVPVGICNKLRTSVANDWWGLEDGKRKLHWRSWDWLSAPKSLGGLGFRDFVLFNQAMLGKQCWRLLTEPDSLCARVLKGRYFPSLDFLSAVKPRASSYTWRSILFGRELLVKGIRWGVGNGESINVLNDNCIPGLSPGTFKTVEELPADTKVCFFLNNGTNTWNMERVNSFFTAEMAAVILQIPVSRQGGKDFLSWPADKFGTYSVRSAYNLARTGSFFAKRCAKARGDASDSAA